MITVKHSGDFYFLFQPSVLDFSLIKFYEYHHKFYELRLYIRLIFKQPIN